MMCGAATGTFLRLNNWQKVLARLDFFQQNEVTLKKQKTPKIMNEQKLIKFCMLIPKSIGHCFC